MHFRLRRGESLFGVRRGATLIALMGAVGLSTISCGGSTTDNTAQSEVGTYTLVTVNGQALPYTVNNTSLGTAVIQSATLNLSAPAYTATVNGTVNGGATQRILADGGTYSRTGSTLTFSSTSAPGLVYAGAFSGSTLTVSIPGVAVGTTGTLQLGMQKS